MLQQAVHVLVVVMCFPFFLSFSSFIRNVLG